MKLKEPAIQRTYDWMEGFKACEKDNQEKMPLQMKLAKSGRYVIILGKYGNAKLGA